MRTCPADDNLRTDSNPKAGDTKDDGNRRHAWGDGGRAGGPAKDGANSDRTDPSSGFLSPAQRRSKLVGSGRALWRVDLSRLRPALVPAGCTVGCLSFVPEEPALSPGRRWKCGTMIRLRTRQRSQLPKAPAPAGQSGCQHHWIIASPHGPTSTGRCKLCGASREFRNSEPVPLLAERAGATANGPTRRRRGLRTT